MSFSRVAEDISWHNLKGWCDMATMGQLYEILAILASNRIDQKEMKAVDGGRLQEEVIKQPDRLAKEFLSFLKNGARAVVVCVTSLVFHVFAKIERDMTGWKCLEPVEREEGEFGFTIHEFAKPEDKGSVGGEEMIRRAKEKGVFSGLRDLEAMLREQEKIPIEMRKHPLVSTEVWQGPRGDRSVWYLSWIGERWFLHYHWLRDEVHSDCRLVASRKCQKQNLES